MSAVAVVAVIIPVCRYYLPALMLRYGGAQVKYNDGGQVWMVNLNSDATDGDLRWIGRLGHIQVVDCRGARVSAVGLKELEKCQSLSALLLHDMQLSQKAMECIGETHQLRTVYLWYCQVENGSLRHLQTLHRLWRLRLDGTNVADTELAHLEDLDDLQYLHLSYTKITGAGLRHLKGCMKTLRELEMRKCPLKGRELSVLSGFVALESLNLSGTKIGDSDLEFISSLKKLKTLNLSQTGIGDEGIRFIQVGSVLQDLDLSHTSITDIGLKRLSGLKWLTRLSIIGTRVTRAGLLEFEKRVPRCDVHHGFD